MSIFNFLTRGYKTHKISIYSGYASFFIAVSAIPFLSIVFYVVGTLSPSLEAELFDFFSLLVPSDILLGFDLIIEEIRGSNVSLLLPAGIVALVWSSCKGTAGLATGVENIYKRNESNSSYFIKIVKSLIFTVIFTITVILSLALCSVGKEILEGVFTNSIWLSRLLSLRYVAFLFVLFIIFLFFYRFISRRRGIFNHAFGALFSTVGWFVFTLIYSRYISFALDAHSIYAGVGGLIFFMLWIYFTVNIILIGALINLYFIKSREKSPEYDKHFIKR